MTQAAYNYGLLAAIGAVVLVTGVLAPTFGAVFDTPEAPSVTGCETPAPTQREPLRLVSTMAGAEQVSLATIADPETGKTGVHRQGDTLRESLILAEIGDGYVVLRSGDSVERLSL